MVCHICWQTGQDPQNTAWQVREHSIVYKAALSHGLLSFVVISVFLCFDVSYSFGTAVFQTRDELAVLALREKQRSWFWFRLSAKVWLVSFTVNFLFPSNFWQHHRRKRWRKSSIKCECYPDCQWCPTSPFKFFMGDIRFCLQNKQHLFPSKWGGIDGDKIHVHPCNLSCNPHTHTCTGIQDESGDVLSNEDVIPTDTRWSVRVQLSGTFNFFFFWLDAAMCYSITVYNNIPQWNYQFYYLKRKVLIPEDPSLHDHITHSVYGKQCITP